MEQRLDNPPPAAKDEDGAQGMCGGDDANTITLFLDRLYPGSLSASDALTTVTGAFAGIPWVGIDQVSSGVAGLVAEVLEEDLGELKSHCAIVYTAAGLRAGKSIQLTRFVSPAELMRMRSVLRVFSLRLQETPKEVVLEALRDVDPKLIDLGFQAAECVRRAAPGSNLTSTITVRVGSRDEMANIAARIGRHPDPETDLMDRPYFGRVLLVDDDRRRFVLACTDEEPEAQVGAGSARIPRGRRGGRGKKIVMQFNPEVVSTEFLANLMVSRTPVRMVATPKLRAGRERLTLQRIE